MTPWQMEPKRKTCVALAPNSLSHTHLELGTVLAKQLH